LIAILLQYDKSSYTELIVSNLLY